MVRNKHQEDSNPGSDPSFLVDLIQMTAQLSF